MSTTQLCSFGCGQPGLYYSSNSARWRCAQSTSSCPAQQEKQHIKQKARWDSYSDEQRLEEKLRKQQGMINKYGVPNPSQNAEIQSKKIITFIERFGTDNPSKNQEVIQKIKDKTGIMLAKRQQTSVQKFGVDSYAKTDEFKRRREETWIQKYGVDNPAKSPEIQDKIQIGQQYNGSYKSITLNGHTYNVQGYEPIVIKELIKSGIPPEEIVVDRAIIPKIKYVDNSGKMRRYYPDIWLPRYNLLIEVKSLYTWQKYKAINLLKINAAKDKGYTIRVMIR